MNKLFYIQTYRKVKHEDLKNNLQSRFLTGNYMGAAEFEFGSLGRARRFMQAAVVHDELFTIHEINVEFKRKGENVTVTFHVLTDPIGVQIFKDSIDFHLNGSVPGSRSKAPTGLYDIFVNGEDRNLLSTHLWMSVDGFIGTGTEAQQRPPIVFTDDAALMDRYYHQLINDVQSPNNEVSELSELKIGDLVKIPGRRGKEPVKVIGLNEDDTISVRIPHVKKASRWNRFDLLKVETE